MSATQFNVKLETKSGSGVNSTYHSTNQQLTSKIKTVEAADQENAIAAMVLAFSTDPAMRWMYPDSHQFLTHFPNFVKAFGGKAFDQALLTPLTTTPVLRSGFHQTLK